MANSRQIRLPERKRSYKFALTPLADAMFQLLIFFMLSSSLTPYSLLTLQTGPAAAQPGAATADANEPPSESSIPSGDVAMWIIETETVIIGGQRFGFDALDDLAAALGSDDNLAEVILVIRPSAQVQDITTVLARLRAAEISSVQITSAAI